MKRMKTSLLILLTFTILIACASLPVIAASIQDGATVNHSGYSGMKSMKLDIDNEKETIPMVGKLALLSNMETIDIDPAQASMTEEEVLQTAESLMRDYTYAGIFQWFDIAHCSAAPMLGIDLNDANNFLVYWTVSYSSWDDQDQSLLLSIDDETGKILCINYDVYGSYSMDGVWERNKMIMHDFVNIFFSQLGLTAAKEYAESTGTGYAYFERDGGVSNALYRIDDAVYGEINMGFYVEGSGGFYLYLPN